jgi:selenide,water dikinase
MGPETLSHVLRQLPVPQDARLLVGPHTGDDAAVYLLDEETALIVTVDFFTPVVDDPYTFGQIAAANALSDVYAMGGRPLLCLNLVGFPACLPIQVLGEILRGGSDKVTEAGAILAGGHTLEDDEPKYGLAVAGTVHPQGLWRNSTARPGDVLILTKPLGTGVINTAAKADMAPPEALDTAVALMRSLNAASCHALQGVRVSACTDVTGFGLLGHAAGMAEASGVTLVLRAGTVPVLEGARDLAAMGMFPAGAYRNRDWLKGRLRVEGVDDTDFLILCDPQTSGGLLAAVPADQVELALARLRERGVPGTVIGEVLPRRQAALELIP